MQDSPHGVMDTVREWWTIALFVGGVLLAALVQKLTGFFVTRRELEALATKEGVDAMRAELMVRVQRAEAEIEEVKEHGSTPLRQLREEIARMNTLLGRIDERTLQMAKRQQ